MKRIFKREETSEQGQILVIVGVGMLVMIAMVGLVIDGGNAWGQQRQTQNGADAMANAGATVIAQSLKGATKTDGDVGCAVEQAASQTSHGGASIAAHVAHLTYGLSLMNRWAGGEANPFATA